MQYFYHIYNRGADKQEVFVQREDYQRMFMLFERYFGPKQQQSANGFIYPTFKDSIKLLSFCLMPNHFHLLLSTNEPDQISKLMQSVKTAYCRYFNGNYGRSGVLFETRYHRRLIGDEADYLQISRYIHLNALAMTVDYGQYPYSSLNFYLHRPAPLWLNTGLILGSFMDPTDYQSFHEAQIRELATSAMIHAPQLAF